MNSLILFGNIGAELAEAAKTTGEQFGFNWGLFTSQCISFAIVCICLQKFAYKPILTVLEERRKKIADSLANADKIKAELASTEAAHKEIMEKAGADATRMIEEARTAAAQLRETESQKAIAEAQSIIEKAREANTAELERMKAELRGEVVRLVAETTAKVAGKVLTDEDQKRLADETNSQIAA
jgi:F-type H+-transporting ATPase subunit b